MKKSGYFAYTRLAADYLIAAAMTSGSPDGDDFLDKAEFYLNEASKYAKMPAEQDLVATLIGTIDKLAERADEAACLFESLGELEMPEPVEE